MKKIIALTLALILVMGVLVGCGNDDPGTEPADSEQVTNGVLRISTSPDFAPMVFVDPTKKGQDQFVGFDIMLAKFIAAELNMELEIMPMDFNSCQLAVYAGTVDMSISGYAWSAERAQTYNISDNYYAGDSADSQVLITLADNADQYATAAGLSGAVVGAQNASLQQLLVGEQLPESELDVFIDLDMAVLQLLNGDFDCIAVSEGNAGAIIANHPEIVRSGFTFELDERQTGNVILLQKGNDELTEKVNEILQKASQYYDQWYQEAKSIAGIQVIYDEDGNVVGEAE